MFTRRGQQGGLPPLSTTHPLFLGTGCTLESCVLRTVNHQGPPPIQALHEEGSPLIRAREHPTLNTHLRQKRLFGGTIHPQPPALQISGDDVEQT